MKYFDYAATCPIKPAVLDAYVQASKDFYGNASSLHDIGGKASSLLDSCRKELGRLLGVPHNGIFFTSGGTESNQLAIQTLLSAVRRQSINGGHIIASKAEHSSIHQILHKLKQEGYDITYIPMTQQGIVDTELFQKAIREDTVLAVIQHGNGEIGSIQPIVEIAKICRSSRIFLHADCVQTFGKMDLTPIASEVDSLSISSHKIYGPKGTGALYINPNIPWKPALSGVSHEGGLRPGTVNVPGIAAFTVAAQLAHQSMTEKKDLFWKLRKTLLDELKPVQEYLQFYNVEHESQLPFIIGCSVKNFEGQWLMLECNRLGFAISTGSACQVQKKELSKTMQAMGVSEQLGKGFVRISLGDETKEEDVRELGRTIVKIISSQ
ncbi:MAG: IscS subfamily cysteine desulfurase [Bacillaceae bacterium]|nr:IscS subfamily cysteine desulfurase [Bacillaceae bacterium]